MWTSTSTTTGRRTGCPIRNRRRRQAGSGIWYYRYACALTYCARLEEALVYARKGVELDPGYVWGYLQYAKLLSHFGKQQEALAAVDRGLELEPGDYEFTTLRREILEGRNLEEMEFHWIDPECDRRLQEGLDEGEADKRRAISHILCNRENLEAIRAALSPTEWEADSPYCTFAIPYGERTVTGRFFGNEAALSKLPALWCSRPWSAACPSWSAGGGPSCPPGQAWAPRGWSWTGSPWGWTGRSA